MPPLASSQDVPGAQYCLLSLSVPAPEARTAGLRPARPPGSAPQEGHLTSRPGCPMAMIGDGRWRAWLPSRTRPQRSATPRRVRIGEDPLRIRAAGHDVDLDFSTMRLVRVAVSGRRRVSPRLIPAAGSRRDEARTRRVSLASSRSRRPGSSRKLGEVYGGDETMIDVIRLMPQRAESDLQDVGPLAPAGIGSSALFRCGRRAADVCRRVGRYSRRIVTNW